MRNHCMVICNKYWPKCSCKSNYMNSFSCILWTTYFALNFTWSIGTNFRWQTSFHCIGEFLGSIVARVWPSTVTATESLKLFRITHSPRLYSTDPPLDVDWCLAPFDEIIDHSNFQNSVMQWGYLSFVHVMLASVCMYIAIVRSYSDWNAVLMHVFHCT